MEIVIVELVEALNWLGIMIFVGLVINGILK